jgi:hypothetical protein
MEKQKLNEELSRIREIMSIILKESNSSLKKNIKLDIEEKLEGSNIKSVLSNVKDFNKLPDIYKNMFSDMAKAIKLNNTPIMINNRPLKTKSEIFTAIKNGSLIGSELGRVEKGFLKSLNTPAALRKSIVVDFVKDPDVLVDLAKVPGGDIDSIRTYLKGKEYADDSIDEIITQLTSNGKIDNAGNFVGSVNPNPVNPNNPNPVNPNNPNPKPNPKWWDSLKTIGWQKALLSAGAVGGALLLWYWFKQNNIEDKDIPVDPPVDPNNEWAPCLKKLKESGQAKVVRTSSNTLVLRVINTTYPDGVLFFTDGRVLTNDGKRKGTWKCKEGKTVVKEQSTGNNLSIDAESVVNSLKGNVITTTGLESIQNILNKYIESGQGKRFLDTYKKISGEFLEKTLISKTTITEPSKRAIRDRIYGKIRTIKGSGGTSTGDSLSGIEITWDDEKKKENTGGGESTIYSDCPSFPLRFGCKGPLVSKLQTCLKMAGVDGKLGPKTMATAEKWATSNKTVFRITIKNGGEVFGVTEDNFNRICGGEPVPEVITPVEPVNPVVVNPPNVDGPVVNPTTKPEKPTSTDKTHPGQDLFNRLIREKKLIPRNFLGNKRMVLRDVELTSEEQDLLASIMFDVYKYSLIRTKEDYKNGDKLIFKQIKEKK